MRLTQFIEAPEIGASIKANKTLSSDAKDIIDRWESVNWTTGPLELGIRANDPIVKEIYNAFNLVRDLLYKKYGNTVTLYRGLRDTNDKTPDPERQLYSWTSSRKVAGVFAGRGNKQTGREEDIYQRPITDEEIQAALIRYEKTGFTSFRGRKFKINKELPKYYDMYDRNNNYITDGDDLLQDLKYEQKELDRYNANIKNLGQVIQKEIPINDIIWITNSANSKEFIVKNHPK